MKPENMQKSFLDKMKALRNSLLSRFPLLNMQEFEKELCQIAHYHYHRDRYMIIGKQREIYDFLIENGYNPYTVYRWLLLEKLPEDIRFQIKEFKMSQKLAVSEGYKRRHETINSLGESIMDAGLYLIRRM